MHRRRIDATFRATVIFESLASSIFAKNIIRKRLNASNADRRSALQSGVKVRVMKFNSVNNQSINQSLINR